MWAVKNDDAGRRIMQQWENAYPHEGWTHREDGTWSCVPSKHTDKCIWAGQAYEQGQFEPILSEHRPDIRRVSWRQINNHMCASHGNDADVCHFMGGKKENIQAYLDTIS